MSFSPKAKEEMKFLQMFKFTLIAGNGVIMKRELFYAGCLILILMFLLKRISII